MSQSAIVWLVPLLPFFGFLFQTFIGRKLPKFLVSIVSCGVILVSAIAAWVLFFQLRGMEEGHRAIVAELGQWIRVPGLDGTDAGPLAVVAAHKLVVDPLTAVMILVITNIGFFIHLYSVGYMAGEARYARYFSFLNLFTGFMLILVMASNLLLMFVGWEGVGLCSYLLIGFWFEKKENAVAGMKAFIVNRVGDLAFTIGVLTLFVYVGNHFDVWTVDFGRLKEAVTTHGAALPAGLVTFVAIMLFVGATGKSAQIPLYIWLPDAMAGPTPVSALIHAATMVTAGVYMIARMNFLYVLSPVAMTVVATVGAATALFAGTIGVAQNDIKKVLAYSTVSQLGFMFMAVGVGAFAGGVFHLFTHAFFKACLFLGSGSVILGMHHEQDIRRMGGLKSKMPWTFWTFAIASLAIAGVPPLAGFFSKDEILWKTWDTHALIAPWWGPMLWVVGAIAAGCTAFYMTRLVIKTFLGEPRWKHAHGHDEGHGHGGEPRESPPSMVIALVVLAIGSAAVGFLGVPHALGGHNMFEGWLAPVVAPHHGEGHHETPVAEYLLMGLSVVLARGGILAAWIVYKVRGGVPAKNFVEKRPELYDWVLNKYYVDEAYDAMVVQPLLHLNEGAGRFDNEVIDGLVNGTARAGSAASLQSGLVDNEVVDGAVNAAAVVTQEAGRRVRTLQTGNIREYMAFALVGGLFVILAFCVYLIWGAEGADGIKGLFGC